MKPWSLLLLLSLAGAAHAEESAVKVEELHDAPPLSGAKEKDTLADAAAAAPILQVGLRTDVAFSAGRATDQGFSLPSLRVNFTGEVARQFDYKLSLAPSREFSSVLIPQVLPVDAWILFRNSTRADATLLWRVGMFAPTLSPSFSPDLADLPIPDYAATHRATLLFRELGTELTLRPTPELEFTAGVFNGSGIVALNTNNAKAFSGAAIVHIGLGDDSELRFGVSGYASRQSDSGSVNFISNTIGSAFVALHLGESTELGLDIVSGRLQDASRSEAVFGLVGSALVGISPWLKAYFRGEGIRYSPVIDPRMNRLQLGPVIEPMKNLRLFVFYEHSDDSTGASENAFQCLIRLVL